MSPVTWPLGLQAMPRHVCGPPQGAVASVQAPPGLPAAQAGLANAASQLVHRSRAPSRMAAAAMAAERRGWRRVRRPTGAQGSRLSSRRRRRPRGGQLGPARVLYQHNSMPEAANAQLPVTGARARGWAASAAAAVPTLFCRLQCRGSRDQEHRQNAQHRSHAGTRHFVEAALCGRGSCRGCRTSHVEVCRRARPQGQVKQ